MLFSSLEESKDSTIAMKYSLSSTNLYQLLSTKSNKHLQSTTIKDTTMNDKISLKESNMICKEKKVSTLHAECKWNQ